MPAITLLNKHHDVHPSQHPTAAVLNDSKYSRGPEDEEPDDTAITPCNVETLEAADNHVRHASLYVRFQLWFSFQPT